MKQLINKANGEVTLYNGFVVSKNTMLKDLIHFFGNNTLKQNKYTANYYSLPQTKIDDYYIIFGFAFKDKKLRRISFQIENEPIVREPWTSQRDLETKWIAQQMQDESNFVWYSKEEWDKEFMKDLKVPNNDYSFSFHWGFIGIYYDFKNGTYDSSLLYKN